MEKLCGRWGSKINNWFWSKVNTTHEGECRWYTQFGYDHVIPKQRVPDICYEKLMTPHVHGTPGKGCWDSRDPTRSGRVPTKPHKSLPPLWLCELTLGRSESFWLVQLPLTHMIMFIIPIKPFLHHTGTGWNPFFTLLVPISSGVKRCFFGKHHMTA